MLLNAWCCLFFLGGQFFLSVLCGNCFLLCNPVSAQDFFSQARKKSTTINFLGLETAQWGGGLPREGVVAEKFVLSLESLSSLGFEERNLGYPGNFAGMSRTPGGVQKFVQKKFVRILRSEFRGGGYMPMQ